MISLLNYPFTQTLPMDVHGYTHCKWCQAPRLLCMLACELCFRELLSPPMHRPFGRVRVSTGKGDVTLMLWDTCGSERVKGSPLYQGTSLQLSSFFDFFQFSTLLWDASSCVVPMQLSLYMISQGL